MTTLKHSQQIDWLETELQSMLSVVDSHAKTSAPLANEQESKGIAPASGAKCSELLVRRDRLGFLLRMSVRSEQAALTGCSMPWKNVGTPAGREWWVQAMPERPINVGVHLSWLPTLATSQAYKPIRGKCDSETNGTHGTMTVAAIGSEFPETIGQYVNPQWWEWFMGFPIGWTEVEP